MAESKSPDNPPSNNPSTPASTPASTDGSAGKTTKPPTKQLATTRIAFNRQFDAVRAFVLAAKSGQAVTLGEVSPHAGLSVNTLSMITGFLVAAKLLTRPEGSKFLPTQASIDFERTYHFDKENAPYVLGPALEDTWFGTTVVDRLKMRGTMTTTEAITLLATEAAASEIYKPQLKATLGWLITTGVIEQDGINIKIARKGQFKPPAASGAGAGSNGNATHKNGADENVINFPPRHTDTDTQNDEAGQISLNVAIRIHVKELEAMTPDRIAAFFQGLAAVVAAKGKE